MRVRGKGAILIEKEGRSPPLPFLEIEDGEAEALIALGLAVEVSDEVEAPAEDAADDQVEEVTEDAEEAQAEESSDEEAQAEESSDDNAGAGPDQGGEEAANRATMIAEALDLMEADDLVKNGERAGKPKVSAIEAATGLSDVTADEIDAAVAAREAA